MVSWGGGEAGKTGHWEQHGEQQQQGIILASNWPPAHGFSLPRTETQTRSNHFKVLQYSPLLLGEKKKKQKNYILTRASISVGCPHSSTGLEPHWPPPGSFVLFQVSGPLHLVFVPSVGELFPAVSILLTPHLAGGSFQIIASETSDHPLLSPLILHGFTPIMIWNYLFMNLISQDYKQHEVRDWTGYVFFSVAFLA